ncbi:MAG: hypothetical protein H6716_21700 [Polyangiaceae bacterium]|nr:hypothetical protein [Polyangiaceae bacterium]
MKRLIPAALALALSLPLSCSEAPRESVGSAPQASQEPPRLQQRITPLRRWVQRQPAHSPPPRTAAAFAYDPTRGVSVLYGGWGCSAPGSCGILSDTWEWNGSDWTERTPTAPAGRVYADAAYDPALGGVNVIGGSYTNTPSNASHYWDGTSWIPSDTSLPGFSLAARGLTYENGASPRMLSFGGDDVTSSVRDFTGQRTPGNNWIYPNLSLKPAARRDGQLIWDPAADKSYLFGGRPCRMTESCQALGDYWEIAGTTWTDLGSGMRPSPRFGHRFLYDASRSVGLLFAGRDAASANAELWQVEFPDTWTQLALSGGPEARSYFGFSYDSGRDVAVLFGGSAGTTIPQGDTNPFGDTWELVLDFDSCTSGADCDNGFCVDGACCEAAACGTCETCADPANVGVCTTVVDAPDPDSCATTCDSAGQCMGECTTNEDCTGACNACDAGECVILSGAPEEGASCFGYLCDGVNPKCPTSCSDASDCEAGVPCSEGSCTLEGAPCEDASTCGGLTCVDNVCCGSPCETCGVCSVAAGAPKDGVCTPALKGTPDDACPIGCSGAETACLESAALPAGSPCTMSTDCLSGSCVGGACCQGSPADCLRTTGAGPRAFDAGTPHDCACRAGAPARPRTKLEFLAPLLALALLRRRRRS